MYIERPINIFSYNKKCKRHLENLRHLEFFCIFWVCALQTGFYRLKKNLVYGGKTRSKESQFFPKNDAILDQSANLYSSTKVRYQKNASNAEKKRF
jgi:hypothetical protein